MSDVFIDPTKGPISIKIEVNSMQAVGYELIVYGADGSTDLQEHHPGNIGANQSIPIKLKKPASAYTSCYFTTTFVIVDPVGAGNHYSIDYFVIQDGDVLNPVIRIEGKTTAGKVVRFATFHLNENPLA
jgi:hypothetical protein